VESSAETIDYIIAYVPSARVTERAARPDDQRAETALEDRKRQGYF
jgi:sulfate adenylyltransferase subunit 2